MPAAVLDEVSRPWRVSYRTGSFASLRSAIRAALAVGPVPARSIDAGMRILSETEGFPALPAWQRSIHISASAPAEIAEAMADTIRQAVLANDTVRAAG